MQILRNQEILHFGTLPPQRNIPVIRRPMHPPHPIDYVIYCCTIVYLNTRIYTTRELSPEHEMIIP